MQVFFYHIIAIGTGGALGTMLRYYINYNTLFVGYPLGTIIENLLGSLLLGMLSGFVVYHTTKEWIRLGVGVGFCGGLTTMSTFAADSFFLYTQVSFLQSIIYILLSLFGGLILAFMGFLLGQKWSRKLVKQKGGERE